MAKNVGCMLAYWVKVGCMLSRVGRVCCALHWEEKEVGREPKGLGGKVWGAWWMRRSERVGAERIVCSRVPSADKMKSSCNPSTCQKKPQFLDGSDSLLHANNHNIHHVSRGIQ